MSTYRIPPPASLSSYPWTKSSMAFVHFSDRRVRLLGSRVVRLLGRFFQFGIRIGVRVTNTRSPRREPGDTGSNTSPRAMHRGFEAGCYVWS